MWFFWRFPDLVIFEKCIIQYQNMLLLVRNYLWKKAFKKFEVIWSTEADHNTSYFLTAGCYKLYLFHFWILWPILCIPCWNVSTWNIRGVFTGNLYRNLYKFFTRTVEFWQYVNNMQILTICNSVPCLCLLFTYPCH